LAVNEPQAAGTLLIVRRICNSVTDGFAQIEFASLPTEFATVGKLSFIRNRLSRSELCPEKK